MDRPRHPLERLYRSATSPAEILAAARAAGRDVLLEPEGLALARLLGFDVPPLGIVHDADEVDEMHELDDGLFDASSPNVVVKAIAAELAHKSDAGAVVRVRRRAAAVAEAIRQMATRLANVRMDDLRVEGYGLFDYVEHDRDLAGELILGLRRTPDFGAVVTVGPGGVFAEHLAGALDADRGLAHFASGQDADSIADRLRRLAVVPMLIAGLRASAQRLPLERLVAAVEALHRLAADEPALEELELNPVAVCDGGLLALDALARLADPAAPSQARRPERPQRPIAKLRYLLQPRSIAVVGVSARSRNPGRIVVENVLAAGFPAERLRIVKPGLEQLDGCRCVADLASLEPVDLLVVAVAVAAEAAAAVLEEVIRRGAAESVILIPGGVGEVAGSEGIADRIREALEEARRRPDAGPVLCGGNCLGVRSRPSRFDSLFIPRHKPACTARRRPCGRHRRRFQPPRHHADLGRRSLCRVCQGRAGGRMRRPRTRGLRAPHRRSRHAGEGAGVGR